LNIGDIASKDLLNNYNLLPNSSFFSGERWTNLGYTKSGNVEVLKEISNEVKYNNHQTLHIKVTN
jgi:hypothetical protein